MILRPPRSRRTDTRFPDTPLFRAPGGLDQRLAQFLADRVVEQDEGFQQDFPPRRADGLEYAGEERLAVLQQAYRVAWAPGGGHSSTSARSEEHTSELQSLMRISYDVFCLKQTNKHKPYRDHK